MLIQSDILRVKTRCSEQFRTWNQEIFLKWSKIRSITQLSPPFTLSVSLSCVTQVASSFFTLPTSWCFLNVHCKRESRTAHVPAFFIYPSGTKLHIFASVIRTIFLVVDYFSVATIFFLTTINGFSHPVFDRFWTAFLPLSSLNNDYFIMLLCFLLCWKGFIFDDVSFFVVALILSLFFVVYWKYGYKEKLWELVKDFLIYK